MSATISSDQLTDAEAHARGQLIFRQMQRQAMAAGFGRPAPIPAEWQDRVRAIYAERARLEHRKALEQSHDFVRAEAARRMAQLTLLLRSYRATTAVRPRTGPITRTRRQPRRQRPSASVRLCRPGGRKKRPRRGSSAADGGGDAAGHTAVRAAPARDGGA
jgi:hypothetical protein